MKYQLTVTASITISALCFGGCAAENPMPIKRDSDDGVRSISGVDMRDTYERDGTFFVSPVLDVESTVQRTGFLVDMDELKLPDNPRFEARAYVDGVPGEWVVAQITWSEDPLIVARADFDVDADAVQIRIPTRDVDRIGRLQWTAVRLIEEGIAYGSFGAQPLLDDESNDGTVVPRTAWGARSGQCSAEDPLKDTITIHHTATPIHSGGSFERRLRAIQAFHMDVRGWCDVGYHYLVADDGRVFAGRPAYLRGAHVAGANTGNMGVAFMGCFDAASCAEYGPTAPSTEMIAGAATTLAALADAWGIDIDAQSLLGHGEHSGAATACPGDNLLAELDALRALVGEALAELQDEIEPETAPAGCGEITWAGECSESLLSYCEDDAIIQIDCANTGNACEWVGDAGWFNCVEPADPCGGLDWHGTCEGDVLRWCQDERAVSFDCSNLGRSCDWQDDQIGNNCL